MSQSQKRKTSTIQVSPELNLVLTKYATEQGISKAEAADRVFNILYPKGVETQPLAPPAEGGEEGAEAPLTGLEFEEEEGEGISKQLEGTVKDLRAVQTIKALTSNLNKKEGADDRITARDAFELEKIKAMRGGGGGEGTNSLDAAFRRFLTPLRREIRDLRGELQAHKETDVKAERDYYRSKLEERDAKEERAQEMMSFISPFQEQFKELSDRVTALAESLKPSSKAATTKEEASEELKAINNLATEIRNGLQKLGGAGGGGGTESLTDTIDTLTTLIDKVNEVSAKFRGGGEGDFDWRAATVSTIGEVANEAFRTYRSIHGGVEEGEEGASTTEEKKEQLSEQVILRRVYNYAIKKIAEGELQLNPYDAAKELNLTPNRVWWAVEELRKKGLLKTGTVSKEKGEAKAGTESPEELRAKGLLEF